MQILNPRLDLDDFFRRIRDATMSVLLLDYDGTLAPFHTDRNRAVPYTGVPDRLSQLANEAAVRLAIISGRAVEDLKPLLSVKPLPEIWGCHGAERLHPQRGYRQMPLGRIAEEGLAKVQAWAGEQGLIEKVEIKPCSVAFHWRGLPQKEIETIRNQVQSYWQQHAPECGLALTLFDGGLELRAHGISKALAVDEILGEHTPDIPIAYLGDDQTDEDAFSTIGPRGLKVLVRPQLRQTVADLWLTPPEELLRFLDRWIDSVT